MRHLALLAMLALDTLVIIVMLALLGTCHLADASLGQLNYSEMSEVGVEMRSERQ